MWIRLGDNELLNLDHVISIKKGGQSTLEMRYANPDANRTVRFRTDQERDLVFERVIKNMVTLGLAME
ncbi:MAG: hypothetical protein K1X75_10980 [Leptospirales bacterium]|nr:hypothetical protein [Leptospirales bacterium]